DRASGSQSPLVHDGEVIGTVLRTRQNVRPVIVSCGHRVGLTEAVALVQSCSRGYRLPEPTRLADKLAGANPGPWPLGEGVPIRCESTVDVAGAAQAPVPIR
ncbi:MAG TPA: hypothetical protein DDW89_03285, partial [Gammaproteobacteria bacterium]|nr:hypothetical protein [Gammaproteobacteria bacterium]